MRLAQPRPLATGGRHATAGAMPGAKLCDTTAFCTDFLDDSPDYALLNGLQRSVRTVPYGLLIRRFWVQVPGGAPQKPRSQARAWRRSPRRRPKGAIPGAKLSGYLAGRHRPARAECGTRVQRTASAAVKMVEEEGICVEGAPETSNATTSFSQKPDSSPTNRRNVDSRANQIRALQPTPASTKPSRPNGTPLTHCYRQQPPNGAVPTRSRSARRAPLTANHSLVR